MHTTGCQSLDYILDSGGDAERRVCVCVWQEVAKRTTTYNTAVQEQLEEDDDDGVEDTEEDFFHQQVRLRAASTFLGKTLGCLTQSGEKINQ